MESPTKIGSVISFACALHVGLLFNLSPATGESPGTFQVASDVLSRSFEISKRDLPPTWQVTLVKQEMTDQAGVSLAAPPVPGHADALVDGKRQAELRCLALNVYFEARSEPHAGQVAVAHVVLNRVRDRVFPETICGVVRQGGERVLNRCQFSWWCDGRSDKPRDDRAWERSKLVAQKVYNLEVDDPTDGALWYHADYVQPSWRHAFNANIKLGRHIFYARKSRDYALANTK